MKKFIITLILIGVGVFAMDRLGEKVLWSITMHANNGIASWMRDIAFENEADVVLMGTSRCNHHYIPSIISDSIGMSTFNVGYDGTESIYSHYIELCFLTAHHIPKLICLDILFSEFSTDTVNTINPYQALCRVAPYYGKNAEADSVFKENPESYLYDISHIYKYNLQAISNIGGLFMDQEYKDNNGYMPLDCANVDLGAPSKVSGGLKTDKNKFKYLQKFVDKCRNNNIDLVFSISPCYFEDLTEKEYFKDFFEFAEANNVPVYNNYTLFFDHPEYFKDFGHMCDSGAHQFSKIIGGILKRHIESKGGYSETAENI